MNKLLTFILIYFSIIGSNAQTIPAFPGAEGFGANATGGRGGKVIYVTNLNANGPGSLNEALAASGPRYILFKVSGVIPTTVEVPPGHGDFTLAGHTSPNGIIVRGFLSYNEEAVSSTNFIIRHLRSRIGDRVKFPTSNWLAEDGITLGGVQNVIIDHCSFGHASDEAVDISRAQNLTIQNCLLTETLGEHAYLGGMLINYSSSAAPLGRISIHHNNWNRIGGRMPEISCESPHCNNKSIQLEYTNNLIWDPGIEVWYEGNTGSGNFFLQMNAENNVYFARPNYTNGMFHHDILHFSNSQLFFSGNKMNLYPQLFDYQLFYCCNDFDTGYPNMDFGVAQRLITRHNFPQLTMHNTPDLPNYMINNVGAFPRDPMDTRVIEPIRNNAFLQIPLDEAGADDAFLITNNGIAPLDSDQDGMPDLWELYQGLNPNVQDHNDLILSQKITSVLGYTNLECYLHCLSEYVINGTTTNECGINRQPTSTITHVSDNITIFPNPASDFLNIQTNVEATFSYHIVDTNNRNISKGQFSKEGKINIVNWPSGIYFITITYQKEQKSFSFEIKH